MTAQEAMTLPGMEVHQMTVPEITAQTMDLMMTVPETEVIMQMRTPEMGMIQDINSIKLYKIRIHKRGQVRKRNRTSPLFCVLVISYFN